MKKIVFVIYDLEGAGAEKVLVDTVNNLDHTKYDITVQTLVHNDTFYSMLDERVHYRTIVRTTRPRVRKILSGILQYVLPPRCLYQWYMKDTYDIEIAFMEGIGTKTLAHSTNKKAKKYCWVHINLLECVQNDRIFFRSLSYQKRCYAAFDEIYCVSQGVKHAFIQRFGEDLRDRTHVIYNVLDDNFVRAQAQKPCPYQTGDAFQMISVAGLSQRKGFERLIRICGRLKREGFRFELSIVGKGELKEKLEQLTVQEGVDDCVFLRGFQKNPYACMAASDLYVCASFAEGFSTVVSEATILGIPVVTTDTSGMREILGDSEFGLVTEDDEEALYVGLRSVLADRKQYEHWKKKAGERSSFFCMRKRLDEYEAILGE